MARKDAGFTLLEIIFVLIIIGVASTMIGSHYASLRVADSQLERAKVQLISAFVQSRNKALLMGEGLELSIEGNTITHLWGQDKVVLDGVTVKEAKTFKFKKDGSVNFDTAQDIILEAKDSQASITLSVEPSGYVTEGNR